MQYFYSGNLFYSPIPWLNLMFFPLRFAPEKLDGCCSFDIFCRAFFNDHTSQQVAAPKLTVPLKA